MADTVYELYRNAIIVWVEDELTREVLTILWGACPLHLAVASSRAGVRALVAGAPPKLKRRVFGVEDLDFAKGNRDQWSTADVVRLEVHEAENLVLDPVCLSAVATSNGAACTTQDFEAEMRSLAERMVAWMACRATLREMAERLQFPSDPGVADVPDLTRAAAYIQSHPAWSVSPRLWAASAHPGALARKLAEWEGLYRSAIGSSDWHALFSGKELLRALRGNGRFRLDATPKRLTRTPAERDLDVAVVLARKMVEMNRVPQWVTELRSALLAR